MTDHMREFAAQFDAEEENRLFSRKQLEKCVDPTLPPNTMRIGDEIVRLTPLEAEPPPGEPPAALEGCGPSPLYSAFPMSTWIRERYARQERLPLVSTPARSTGKTVSEATGPPQTLAEALTWADGVYRAAAETREQAAAYTAQAVALLAHQKKSLAEAANVAIPLQPANRRPSCPTLCSSLNSRRSPTPD